MVDITRTISEHNFLSFQELMAGKKSLEKCYEKCFGFWQDI